MRRLLTLCGAVMLAACNHIDAPDVGFVLPQTETNVAGTFNLTTANGTAPPFDAVVTSFEVWRLLDDRIIIHDDQTWADTTDFTVENRTDGSTQPKTTASNGTYNIANGHINFTMVVGGNTTFAGAVVGNDLSVNFNGRLFRYVR